MGTQRAAVMNDPGTLSEDGTSRRERTPRPGGYLTRAFQPFREFSS
ncbi:hypothetical protein SAMN02746041_02256 [Desulfacinum hydrothermale DSM 13146]|uniref:Uncharacterized protein n=1 Tax=Desulfacinum hydrothermale DSM 13146 TaxID=1121390 RepID=A0A1W1XN05_9BACT|nr:hypothetical protein SAMN02746041_02256 [Desulfacinum hydrothermale DSM 13146]